jgi:hypothetical protein
MDDSLSSILLFFTRQGRHFTTIKTSVPEGAFTSSYLQLNVGMTMVRIGHMNNMGKALLINTMGYADGEEVPGP